MAAATAATPRTGPTTKLFVRVRVQQQLRRCLEPVTYVHVRVRTRNSPAYMESWRGGRLKSAIAIRDLDCCCWAFDPWKEAGHATKAAPTVPYKSDATNWERASVWMALRPSVWGIGVVIKLECRTTRRTRRRILNIACDTALDSTDIK